MRHWMLAAALAGLAAPVAADELIYRNARFGVSAPVPGTFLTLRLPETGDGRVFHAGEGSAQLSIYGSNDALGGLAPYRRFLKSTEPGEVTYETGGDSWFVLSGFEPDGRVFYLRVEAGRDCSGAPVFGHWRMTYPEAERAAIDPLLETLPERLEVGC
ncbi:hypothetical protein [Roseivivax sp. CAU 1761]